MIEYVQAIEGIISLVALVVLIFGPLQWVCTDAARQHLFHLRDQLFDLARAGKLEFASDDYRLLRSAFDKQIRFAHLLTFFRFVMLIRTAKRLTTVPRSIDEAISRIADSETRAEVRRLVTQMNQTVVLMLVAKSPILWILGFIAFVCALVLGAKRRFAQHKLHSPVLLAKDACKKLIGRSVDHIAPLIHEEAAGLSY